MDPNFMNTIRLSEYDNVVVALSKLEIGMIVDQSQVTTTPVWISASFQDFSPPS
jgi:hypothetical protein